MPTRKKTPRWSPITAWSYSVYQSYLKCPFSVCLDKVQKIRIIEPPNPFFAKGDRVHGSAEQFVKGGAIKVEPELKELKPLLKDLKRRKAQTELEWAFDRAWNPVSWFARECWLRIKTDICADTVKPPEVDIVDWKTGKVHPEHQQQRSLYALGGLQLVSIGQLAGGSKDVKLTARHVYVDTTQTATENFVMKDLTSLKKEWTARTEQMLADTEFALREGPHCRWCKFRKSAGGPCPAQQ